MSLSFEMGSGGLPVGPYAAEFAEAEAFENDYGAAVRLTFVVLSGDHEGEPGTRIVSQKLSPKSNLHKFVKALKGAAVEPGERIDLESFYGTRGTIVVEETDSGGTRVGSFLKS